jgi:hypothetical protein
MKYRIYQFRLTDEEVNSVNDGKILPAYESYLTVSMRPTKNAILSVMNRYQYVADITANCLSEVFQIGNIGPQHYIEKKQPMRSISVGDVIENESGEMYFVDRVGFKSLSLSAE